MELNFSKSKYDGPELEGYKSQVDEEDLEHILISSREHIYSHPIQTLVQEYVNNAKDANRSAGNHDHAIDITVPTRTNLNFICRDYGVGLNKDEIIQVYRKIGKSTKRTNNSLAGKYGVGAKIGFVYADAFLITSWKDGRKVECLAHKANCQIGEYTFLSDEESNEPNGVQISIQLKDASHINEFTNAIKRIFLLWDKKPNIINTTIEWPKVIYSNDSLKIVDGVHGLWLDVDGTPYKVSLSMENKCDIDIRFYSKSVYIKTKLEDVDIPMNREEVITNEKLEKFLIESNKKIANSKNEIIQKIQSRDDYKSLSELDLFINSFSYCHINNVEVYSKILDRKISYIDGYYYIEPKENDLFQHINVRNRSDEKQDKTKIHITNAVCKKYSKFSESRLRKYDNRATLWYMPDDMQLPEDIKSFFDIVSFADLFPTRKKEKVKKDVDSYEVGYYRFNYCNERSITTKEKFLLKFDINKPIYYSLFERKSAKESILYKLSTLYIADIGDSGHVIGFLKKDLKVVSEMGYKLICLDNCDYKFSKNIYKYLKRDICNVVCGDYTKITKITSNLDKDINYLKQCYCEGNKPSKGVNYNDDYLPEHLKNFVKKEETKIRDVIRKVNKKYPFLSHCNSYNIKEIAPWMSTFLIPLLSSNQKL